VVDAETREQEEDEDRREPERLEEVVDGAGQKAVADGRQREVQRHALRRLDD
jgi:hypothetical protein